MVMCRLPMMRVPASGFLLAYCFRRDISPGISCSARRISLRPNSASERSFTLNGSRPAAFAAVNGCIFSVTVAICLSSFFAALPFGGLRAFRAFVFSCLHTRCDEQSRPLGLRVRRQRNNLHVLESTGAQESLHVFVAEPEPHVTHLLAI